LHLRCDSFTEGFLEAQRRFKLKRSKGVYLKQDRYSNPPPGYIGVSIVSSGKRLDCEVNRVPRLVRVPKCGTAKGGKN
jgi:hypothetical protein